MLPNTPTLDQLRADIERGMDRMLLAMAVLLLLAFAAGRPAPEKSASSPSFPTAAAGQHSLTWYYE